MIGSTNGGCFNGVCESGEKFKRVDKLLFGPVGTKLVDLYMQCWKKADLVFCLKEAAEHTWTTMSPLSITEVVSRSYLYVHVWYRVKYTRAKSGLGRLSPVHTCHVCYCFCVC